ncbi:MAG: alpha/beta fold hydrolase [Candidatus Hydrogenedentota bacterium]
MNRYLAMLLLVLFITACGGGKDTEFNEGDFVKAYKESSRVLDSDNPLDKLMARTYMSYLKNKKYYGSDIKYVSTKYKDKNIIIRSITNESEGLTITGLLAEPIDTSARYPGIVICHGYYPVESYFQGQGTEETMKIIARKGYVVLMTDYRGYYKSEGKSKVEYPGEFIDCMSAIQSLRKYERVISEKVGVIGYSWGGGFALRTLLVDDNLKCGVLYYPELGGVDMPKKGNYNYLVNLGASDEMIQDYFKKWSPLYYTAWLNAPVLIFHGKNDRTVLPEQSITLEQMLKANNKEVELIMFDDLPHAFADSPNNPSMKKLFEFLERKLKT